MDIYNPTKTCSKCGIEKPVSEFYKDKRKNLGLQCQCKLCMKMWYQVNKERKKEYDKSYFDKNREKKKEYQSKYLKNKRDNNSLYKLRINIGNLVKKSIKKKGFRKNTKTSNILGCDIQTFREHLECQFTPDMNWSNHGTYWDIDHIIPVSSAKTEDDIIKLNHYTNLQPLESYYNRHIKKNRII